MTSDRRSRSPAWSRAIDRLRDQSGVALFMVLAAVGILFTVVFEFSYVVNVNQKLALDGMDHVKAHYLAKTGFKISLLRLKAYQNVKNAVSSMTGGNANAQAMVPKSLLDQIWSFPFVYPIPSNLPNMTMAQKDLIEQFQTESNIEGSFTALIESESSKLNLNSILAPYAFDTSTRKDDKKKPPRPRTPNPKPTDTPEDEGDDEKNQDGQFNADAARQSLRDFFQAILERKFEEDPDFEAEYRDFRLDDFMDSLYAWVDRGYERRYIPPREIIEPKGAPFYTLNELRLIEPLDDRLFKLFAPALTVAPTPDININTMEEPVLRALIPSITDEEVKEFFEYRMDPNQDNLFKNDDQFFKYLAQNVGSFRNDSGEINRFKDSLKKRNIKIVVDESTFKITVAATVGQVTRTLEAWVTLTGDGKGKSTQGSGTPNGTPPATPRLPGQIPTATEQGKPDPGLKVTFMRLS